MEKGVPKKIKGCHTKVHSPAEFEATENSFQADLGNFIMEQVLNENNEVVTNIHNINSVMGNIGDQFHKGNRSPLYSESIYFLNKSRTKWVAVGLCSEIHFDPVVRIMGKGQCITLKEADWKNILCYKATITSGFGGHTPLNFTLCGVSITCEWIENARKVLKLERGAEHVYLAYDSIHELWKVGEIVSNRLDMLKSLDYRSYYDGIVGAVCLMPGDVKRNVISILNGTLCEQTCITKEVLLYGIDKIMWDIDLHKIVQM